MLDNLFKKDDDEKRQMSEGMQSMSEQIGALSKQLADKNSEIERLQASAKSAASARLRETLPPSLSAALVSWADISLRISAGADSGTRL